MINPGIFLGVLVQLALLGTLDAVAGLGPLGWLAGAAYGIAVGGFLTYGLHRSTARSLGPADAVTLARSGLVGCVTALVVDTAGREIVTMVVIASVAWTPSTARSRAAPGRRRRSARVSTWRSTRI
ncbi:hypothetical protein [Amycolatopsis thailandensis]|uniref:hypothetical protein n=1 Tax=Amycolatopsis thailandensis TaxID=589330 RepID=UPI0026A48155